MGCIMAVTVGCKYFITVRHSLLVPLTTSKQLHNTHLCRHATSGLQYPVPLLSPSSLDNLSDSHLTPHIGYSKQDKHENLVYTHQHL